MSFLLNPNFDTNSAWTAINQAGAVSWGTGADPRAMSGTNVGAISTTLKSGSVGQDVTVNAPSVSCFAFVRPTSPQPMSGTLAIWNLDTNTNSSTVFTADDENSWQLVVNTFSLGAAQPHNVRVEIYMGTINATLLLDCVNLF
ncbi:hypothetical protein [Arthrobacter sp. NPDC058192]|uniref:hypothetical protein n=1 Tax=Arthrobacter sp. NPDC058192 TaxID=3346372 RepID=UPI0036E0670D